ncbi:hypothetical protein [Bradyrhizobium sp. LMTR 3]|uniref:hypothetical protein n=1 Tax=Bradyrhizobium sp. LMTR 3 TaxID=189873 RepID=UPI0011474FD6|nr:hypothetical protein [Bradyrhizobium sp. LMTR 3]
MADLIEKGGLRGDDNFPTLSPVWPRQRPANAFAGLTRNLSQISSWSAPVAMRRRTFARSRLHFDNSPRFDANIR